MEECDLSGLKRASCRCLFSNKDGLWRQQTLDTSSWKLWGKREAEGRSQHRALCRAQPGAVSPLPLVTSIPSSAGRPGAHLEKQEHLGSPSGVSLCPMGGSWAYIWPAGTEGLGDGGPLNLGTRKMKVIEMCLPVKGSSAQFQAQHFSSHLWV